jgi:hypothetical protein
LGFFFGVVWDDDASLGLFLAFETLDDHPVMQGTKLHGLPFWQLSAYSNASGHAFQYEAGRGFRFDPGHPACFYRSF